MFGIRKFLGLGKRVFACDECGSKHVVVQYTPNPRISRSGNADFASAIAEDERNKERRIAELRREVGKQGYRLTVCETDLAFLECESCGHTVEMPDDFWSMTFRP